MSGGNLSTLGSVQEVSPSLRLLGEFLRSTPYFKGKWRLMEWFFRRWIHRWRVVGDVQLNPSVRISCKLWDEVQFGIWWGGETYERIQTQYFKSLMKPGDVFFDIGSNIGYYSLTAAPLVGPGGKIYAFEPATQQFTLLNGNIARNGLNQIEPVQLALSDTKGPGVLHLDDTFNTGSAALCNSSVAGPHEELVTCTTLDDFVDSRRIDRIDAMKIDVEGFEMSVLRGGRRTLERLRPTLLIEVKEHHLQRAGLSREELYAYLRGLGYTSFRIKPHGRLDEITEPEDGVLVVFRAK